MKYLIMCEGPNELEIIRMLLEHDKLIFTEDDLLNLVPYHARQIRNNASVKNALNLYYGDVEVLRIGDKLNEELKIPKEYKGKIKNIRKYCTKPELEMLLIISENRNLDFEKVKAKISPKTFSKENIVYNRPLDCGHRSHIHKYRRLDISVHRMKHRTFRTADRKSVV